MKTVPSPILRSFVPFLFFLINILAVYLLFRGHNAPGGGFIAGLTSAISWILLTLALPREHIQTLLERDTVRLAAWGLLLSAAVGVWPMVWGEPFLTHNLDLHSPLLFDIGIYFLVLGVVGKIGFSLRRGTEGIDPLSPKEEERYGGCSDDS